jgi:hypothetical protein
MCYWALKKFIGLHLAIIEYLRPEFVLSSQKKKKRERKERWRERKKQKNNTHV